MPNIVDIHTPIIEQARGLAHSDQVIEDIEQQQYLSGYMAGKAAAELVNDFVPLSMLIAAMVAGIAVGVVGTILAL